MIEYKSGERLGYIKKSPHSPECVSSIEIAKCSKNNDKLRENKIKELNNLYNKTTRVVYNKNGIKLNRFKRKATLELKPYSIDTELSEQIIYFNTSFRSTSEQQDIEEEKTPRSNKILRKKKTL